ncbi:hypothetical protein [Natrinema sp. 1APR25-10V2]|uniref:DUF7551 domain-containing protein n=1 Tax=Natrinema sp. 1APR25-10V2 TaxID=2951081 RepID=UPI002876F894|nr:hypothetical protein [Natrinema sp. 1APR25-10V2]MDS0476094.1 hypothetical protein [Natrinema sp. 1APR25-10V2]
MVGTTLREIRSEIERLASDDGAFYVVGARSGERPVPVTGHRFATRAAAAEAARATEQYRAALRRYDPKVPFYDPIVCEERPTSADGDAVEADSGGPDRSNATGEPCVRVDREERARSESPLIEFCHDVSGAVFEALSARNHEAAERAIMDAYLAAAEAPTDRNTLCLVMLETMASELERQLDAAEQRRVLTAAAAALPPVDPAADPVKASLAHVDSLSLVSEYGVNRESDDGPGETWTVSLRGYAIECGEGRFPTLPIGIDLLRRTAAPIEAFGVTDVTALGDGDWRFVLTNAEAERGGLVCTRGETA